MRDNQLKITEIFYSIQGESETMGWPTVFIRLTGCPLRCVYCDTAYAFHGGQWMSIDEIVQELGRHPTRYVTVTGGEPLSQKRCLDLLRTLCDQGYQVSLETSGALDVAAVDPRVMKVVDLKTPGSGELEKNRWQNLKHLNPQDQLKFVLCDREDYQWAKQVLEEKSLEQQCQILFSPVYEKMSYQTLAEWILEDGLPVRMQVQMHKIIWGDEPGR